MRRILTTAALVLICLIVRHGTANAQSAIAGIVRDTSGAVLPGVTVEAASDALIEKTRSVTTDGQGQYKIVDLRPGVYTITFSLPGFSTVRREGVELPTNFTASINGELRVGSLEETVNVSGQSPVVDVQSAVQQTVMNRQILDAVPTGRSVPTLGALLPGARLALPDVGGTSGMQNRDLTVHGSDGKDTTFQVDGMTLNGIEGDGSVQSYFNDMMFEEISYQTSAINAEVSAGGIRANMIPKDGGNQFKGAAFFSGANQNMQANNSSSAVARGLRAPDALNKVWDLNVSEGGPIMRDKLWFFATYRDWGVYQYTANSFFADGTQNIDDASIRSGALRLTTRLGEQHKLAAYLDRIRKFRGHEPTAPSNPGLANAAIAGEATDIRAPKQYYTGEVKYTGTLTSRFLVEAGLALNNESYDLTPQPGSANVIPRRDTILTTAYGSYDGGVYYREPVRRTVSTSASYVTGSHNMKVGVQDSFGYFWRQRREVADLVQVYRSGVPSQVIIHNTPQDSLADLNADLGVYAQDSWTLGRLTLNPGVRFEHFNGSIPARQVAAGRFVPFRSFTARDNVPNWNNISPRFGLAWDVQGTGATAVKFGWGKYMTAYSTGFAETYDPNFYDNATLPWVDVNGDDIAQGYINYAPDGTRQPCVFLTPGCEIDFSTLNPNFGVRPSRDFDPNIQRPFQYEMNASIQRQIVPGTSVTVSYLRRDYRNLIWSDNLAVSSSDYTPYTVPNPIDPSQTVTIYDLNPAKASAVNILDRNSSLNSRVYSGYDVTFNSRFRDVTVFGGVSLGHTISNTCQVADPNFLAYCDQSKYNIPMYPQYKLNGSYMFPWKLQVSGTLQSYAGNAANSTVDGTIAAVDPSLRVVWNVDQATFKSLTGATLTQPSVSVQLLQPGKKLLDRQNQLDLRLKRAFRVGKVDLEGQFDAYNALNSGVVLSVVQNYGSALDRPASILQGRLIRLGLQAKF
ncbi:MAG: carboxypeptidase regulatory-like domain-containing protein [Acidobacteriaceae bacterium]|jgi:hypothetical protein|nr:carboxypeptidase regulatory-like domain-containing protein [Acidobacteriaceae bacterium]